MGRQPYTPTPDPVASPRICLTGAYHRLLKVMKVTPISPGHLSQKPLRVGCHLLPIMSSSPDMMETARLAGNILRSYRLYLKLRSNTSLFSGDCISCPRSLASPKMLFLKL